MLITCRLWKAIKKYSLSPEVRWCSSPLRFTSRNPSLAEFQSNPDFFSIPIQDAKSHLWKVRFLLLNVSFCAFAGFFYYKHNMYCESGSKYLGLWEIWKCPQNSQNTSVTFSFVFFFHRLYIFRPVWVSHGLLQHGLPPHGGVGL